MPASTQRNLLKIAEEILPLLSPGSTVCVFDTETNGLPRGDKVVKIIQFSGIRFRVLDQFHFEEIDFLDRFINPEEPLPSKIVELTGITDDILREAPNEFIVGPRVFRFLDSADVWAAYNANFDLGRLTEMAERIGIYFEEHPCIDVLQMSRDWLKKGEDVVDNRLGTTYSFLFPDGELQFHNSMEDVRATVAVMEALLPKYTELDVGVARNIHVTKVRAWINPKQQSQQRIRIELDAPFPVKEGDIFYDAIQKCWSHASSAKARNAFDSFSLTDFREIEKQTLELASNAYHRFQSMDELARQRISFLLKKQRENKQIKGQIKL